MKLKPCPFCGKSVAFVDSIAEIEHIDEGDPYKCSGYEPAPTIIPAEEGET